MKIIFTGDKSTGERWAHKVDEYISYLSTLPRFRSDMANALFSPADYVEIIFSNYNGERIINIISSDQITEEVEITGCIAVGKSPKDYRVYIADDFSRYRRYEIDIFYPSQVVVDIITDSRISKVAVAPRVTREDIIGSIESDLLSEKRLEFGKKIAFYNNVLTEYMIKHKYMGRDEHIIAVGILGE